MTKSFKDLELIDPLHLIFISELEEEYKIYHFLDFLLFNQTDSWAKRQCPEKKKKI